MWCLSLQKSMGVKGVYESIHSLKIFDLLACPGLSVNIEEATVTEQEQWREVREKYSDLSCLRVVKPRLNTTPFSFYLRYEWTVPSTTLTFLSIRVPYHKVLVSAYLTEALVLEPLLLADSLDSLVACVSPFSRRLL